MRKSKIMQVEEGGEGKENATEDESSAGGRVMVQLSCRCAEKEWNHCEREGRTSSLVMEKAAPHPVLSGAAEAVGVILEALPLDEQQIGARSFDAT